MANFSGKFNSVKQDWTTPISLFDRLNAEFRFETDLAASASNTLCGKFFSEQSDSMTKQWSGVCWLNPPYGSTKHRLSEWIKKASSEVLKNSDTTVVMLIPARTNTSWWHTFCMKASEVRFIRGRPRFGDAKHGLPQPMAIVVFRGNGNPTKFSTFDL